MFLFAKLWTVEAFSARWCIGSGIRSHPLNLLVIRFLDLGPLRTTSVVIKMEGNGKGNIFFLKFDFFFRNGIPF